MKTNLAESVVFDAYLLFYFLKKLSSPFTAWPAYEYGIIDDKGNVLRKRATLTDTKEKNSFGILDLLILNMKKLIAKIPGGQTSLSSFVAASFLVKESATGRFDSESTDVLYEALADHYELLKRKEDDLQIVGYLTESTAEIDKFFEDLKKAPLTFRDLEEDGIANSVGNGVAVGLNEPIVPITTVRRNLKKFKDL